MGGRGGRLEWGVRKVGRQTDRLEREHSARWSGGCQPPESVVSGQLSLLSKNSFDNPLFLLKNQPHDEPIFPIGD